MPITENICLVHCLKTTNILLPRFRRTLTGMGAKYDSNKRTALVTLQSENEKMYSSPTELQLLVKTTSAIFFRCCICDVYQKRRELSSTSPTVLVCEYVLISAVTMSLSVLSNAPRSSLSNNLPI